MRNMSFQVPKWGDTKPKETFAKMVSFWLKPSILERLDAVCSVSNTDRSKALRLMVSLFLNDNAFQERILEGVKNNV
jgi:hypothetical protein